MEEIFPSLMPARSFPRRCPFVPLAGDLMGEPGEDICAENAYCGKRWLLTAMKLPPKFLNAIGTGLKINEIQCQTEHVVYYCL